METSDHEVRTRAIKRVRAKRELRSHLILYAAVNMLLVVIWAATEGATFWPVWSMLGWALFGLAPHAWAVYGRSEPSEERIQREIGRIQMGRR